MVWPPLIAGVYCRERKLGGDFQIYNVNSSQSRSDYGCDIYCGIAREEERAYTKRGERVWVHQSHNTGTNRFLSWWNTPSIDERLERVTCPVRIFLKASLGHDFKGFAATLISCIQRPSTDLIHSRTWAPTQRERPLSAAQLFSLATVIATHSCDWRIFVAKTIKYDDKWFFSREIVVMYTTLCA